MTNETNQNIIFITRQGASISSYNSVLLIPVIATILFNARKKMITRTAFTGPEINPIHSVGQAFSLEYEAEKSQKGIVSINTIEYEKTTTEKVILLLKIRKFLFILVLVDE